MLFRSNKNIFSALILFVTLFGTINAVAQNNTSSPYSYYGLGELSQPVNGISSAMGGTGMAFRNSNSIDIYNPAALANLDSLKFIFNVGLVSKTTNLNQKGKSDLVHDNNFSQLSFGFRVSPRVATAVSLTPYTNVGYDISTREKVTGSDYDYIQRTLTGSGGLNKLTLANGVSILENLSLGVNTNFLFGNNTTDEIVVLQGSSYVYSSQQQLISQGIYFDFGLQYTGELNREWDVTVGAKFQPELGVRSKRKLYVTNYQSSVGDTIYKNTLDRGSFDVPMSYGFGLGFTKNKQLWIGADYLHERWSETEIFKESNQLKDRNRFSVGMNYNANDGYATKFLKKLSYRFGTFYDTGYIKVESERINTKGVSFGLGLPMAKGKGMLNISFEFGQMGTTDNDNIREDFGRVTIEMSLFERWFIKRKYQ
jgi:hypothetical protein